MSFFDKVKLPGAKAGVAKPQKVKMPEQGGDSQFRAKPGFMRGGPGAKLSPLPKFPTQPLPPDTGLLHSVSPASASGLNGVRKAPRRGVSAS
jgi:hypothetical protein